MNRPESEADLAPGSEADLAPGSEADLAPGSEAESRLATGAPVTATDALVILFNALPAGEQDGALARLNALWQEREAGSESITGGFIRSLRRVTEHVGHVPGVDEYKQAHAELLAAGEDIESFARLYKHFGSWPRAREALDLSATTTARRIDARFRYRQLGKVWRFTEAELADALGRAVEHWGHLPTVADYEWWRERELELARAAGNPALQLPSASPFRRKWGTWEEALLALGHTPEEAEKRFGPKMKAALRNTADPYLPPGLPVAELAAPAELGREGDCQPEAGCQPEVNLPLDAEQMARLRTAWNELPRRSRYILTVRLGLDAKPLGLLDTGAPLALSVERVRQLQLLSMQHLLLAAAGSGDPGEAAALREPVEAALRAVARSAEFGA